MVSSGFQQTYTQTSTSQQPFVTGVSVTQYTAYSLQRRQHYEHHENSYPLCKCHCVQLSCGRDHHREECFHMATLQQQSGAQLSASAPATYRFKVSLRRRGSGHMIQSRKTHRRLHIGGVGELELHPLCRLPVCLSYGIASFCTTCASRVCQWRRLKQWSVYHTQGRHQQHAVVLAANQCLCPALGPPPHHCWRRSECRSCGAGQHKHVSGSLRLLPSRGGHEERVGGRFCSLMNDEELEAWRSKLGRSRWRGLGSNFPGCACATADTVSGMKDACRAARTL